MYTSSDEEEALVMLAMEDDNSRKRRKWVHDINLERLKCGEYHTLMPQLRKDDKRCYIYFRMTIDCFDELLHLVENDIRKSDTNYREAISPEERLAITLRYLATGDTFYTIGHSFRVGFSIVSAIVVEVCEALCRNLQHIYLPEPTTEIWKKSEEGFRNTWRFPNCIGSIDGKHVTIKCPDKTGSNYWCYLNKFSTVLMAIVGPDYRFISVNIGGFGKNSDGGIFEASNMGRRFETNQMGVPEPKNLPGQNELSHHVLIGDEAFALKPYLLRPFPYSQRRTDIFKENYNVRLCKARRVVENAFGILAQKWRIFYRPMETKIDTSILIVKTACILHNFLRTKKCDDRFIELLDPPETELGAFQNLDNDPRRAARLAFSVREKFATYFNSGL
ncbi:uncharacterized protein LOC126878998 [Diabrotica virgifera virgifera]|uniref:DDE Tnp4 domain-containing protein n=1 Tax=Diabrotica virgifera virgifera TaxID=50390 RepID=A0ABM5JIR9_DIAVI|nr:uncharacterized protein LOC126878998 [Diabrotica virgifera virgifera]